MNKKHIQILLLIFGFHNIFFASYETKIPLNHPLGSLSSDSEFENINAFEGKPIEKAIIDTDFIKIIMQYYKIIQSWQTRYWYLPGFKAYDMQNLVTTINNDIHAHTISGDQLHFILDILTKQIPDTEIKSILEIIKIKFKSLSTTYETQLLKKIHETVFKITNPNQTISFEAYQKLLKKISPIVGEIETVDTYILKEKNRNLQNIMQDNLKNFKAVIDSRGDGNCGYRSIIISTWMNNPTFTYNYFKNLLENNFLQLFQEFDQTFEYKIEANKAVIAKEILSYLLSVLEQMKNTTSQDKLLTLLNNETTFDYFMIMFIRYMLADYIQNHATEELFEFIKIKDEKLSQKETELIKILQWKDELDNLETTLLADATSIQIHTVQQDAQINSQTITNLKHPLGHAYILFTDNPGHYKILINNAIKLQSLFPMQPIEFKRIGKYTTL